MKFVRIPHIFTHTKTAANFHILTNAKILNPLFSHEIQHHFHKYTHVHVHHSPYFILIIFHRIWAELSYFIEMKSLKAVFMYIHHIVYNKSTSCYLLCTTYLGYVFCLLQNKNFWKEWVLEYSFPPINQIKKKINSLWWNWP